MVEVKRNYTEMSPNNNNNKQRCISRDTVSTLLHLTGSSVPGVSIFVCLFVFLP